MPAVVRGSRLGRTGAAPHGDRCSLGGWIRDITMEGIHPNPGHTGDPPLHELLVASWEEQGQMCRVRNLHAAPRQITMKEAFAKVQRHLAAAAVGAAVHPVPDEDPTPTGEPLERANYPGGPAEPLERAARPLE